MVRSRKVLILSLKARTQDQQEIVFRLHKDRVVIGSVVSADVRLSGDGIAPIHAVLEIVNDNGVDTPMLYDLASDSGVFVNGQKTVTQAIKAGDEITIGLHVLKFDLEDLEAKSFRPDRIWESEGRKLFFNPDEDFRPLNLEDERVVEEIFDYGPSAKQALQVVMSWHGTVLDIEHFTKQKEVTLGGSRQDDFGIPPILNAKSFAIVSQQGASFVLNLAPEMKGVMHRKGQLRSLEDLKGEGNHLAIEKDDFAKVTLGTIDFYLSYTAAPPRLKRRRLFEKDPFFMRIFLASMLISAVTITALLSIPVQNNLETEQLPERIATILYQPEKFEKPKPKPTPTEKPVVEKAPEPTPPKVEPPKPKPEPTKTVKLDIVPKKQKEPKPVPKTMQVAPKEAKKSTTTQTKSQAKANKNAQSEAKEGEGARAKGTEGSRGSKNAAKSDQKQNTAYRPSPQGGAGRGQGHSQVEDQGNLDILKGATGKIQDLLGNTAANLGAGGEKLKGFGGFNTQGNGGLALSGTGAGGGGDAATLGGLGNKGTGGGRVGTGKGAAGNGNGIIGGKTRVALRTGGDEETVVMGSIDPDAIEAALRAHMDEFRLCYEKEINTETGKIAGKVIPVWTIGSSGRVTNAGIYSTTLKNENVSNCVVRVIKRIQFPIPQGAGNVEVRYPFAFAPVGG